MKNVFFTLTLLCTMLLASCKKDDLLTDSQPIVGRWRLSEMSVNDSRIVKPSPYNGRYEVEIEFFENNSLKGTTSSNKIGGSYSFSGQDSITMIYGYETKVGEIHWCNYFTKAIAEPKTYSILGNFLELRGQGSDKLIFLRVR